MKKTLLCLTVSLLPFSNLRAQNDDSDYSLRYGRITDYELRMDTYERDTSASAVFIYEKTDVFYEVSPKINLIKEYSAKIKILRNDGTSWADVEIPYYESSGSREGVSSIDAVAYNLENGKMVKTPLKRQMVFREQVSDKRRMVKFSIPDVRAGTVVEFKYRLSSDFIGSLPNIYVQHSIPVINSSVRVTIPEWFKHTRNSRGHHVLDVKTETINESANFPAGNVTYRSEVTIAKSDHVPAIKNEPFVWNYNDFRARIDFEISGYQFPYGLYHTISANWQSVNKTLADSDFGRYLKMSCPYKEFIQTIKELDPREQVGLIHRYVMSNVKWNDRYRLIPENPRNALKDGSGSSADINFLIMSGLRECGIQCVPVLLNPRPYGRLPYGSPSIEKINTFVIWVELPDASFAMDGTEPYSGPGVLKPDLMVDRARIYGIDDESGWINLLNVSGNRTSHFIVAKVDEGGRIETDHIISVFNTPSISLNRSYSAAGSEDKYIEELEDRQDVRITSFEIEGAGTTAVKRTMKYNLNSLTSGSDIMVGAVVIGFMKENMLKNPERTLPLEFSYPTTTDITCLINIPEGYSVTDIPKNIAAEACDGGVGFLYRSQLSGNLLTVQMSLKMDRVVYTVDEYQDLRAFYGVVSDLCGSRIVLSANE